MIRYVAGRWGASAALRAGSTPPRSWIIIGTRSRAAEVEEAEAARLAAAAEAAVTPSVLRTISETAEAALIGSLRSRGTMTATSHRVVAAEEEEAGSSRLR